MASWQGMIEFIAVADTQSFTKAADRIGVSTAHVSRQISMLEERLATRFFFRTTRKVSLTEEGDIYYRHCKMLLDGLKDAESAVTQLHETLKGVVRITAPVTYGEQRVLPLVIEFMQNNPDIEVEVDLTNRQLDLIDAGVDVAIRLGKLVDSSMVCRRLASRRLIVCGSPDYLSRHGSPHSLSELSNHNCLRGQHDHWRFREFGREHNVRVSGSLSCNSGLALCSAARKGLGLVQLPDYYLAEDLEQGSLVKVLGAYQDQEEGIWALYPHRRLQPLRVRALVDYLAGHLADDSETDGGILPPV